MDQPTYHVQLQGRTVGPYDRRTIVGMRIKHMLTGDQLLVTSAGSRLTVRDLMGAGPSADAPRQTAEGVRASATGMLLEATRGGFPIPRFRGELDLRVQADALRLAGRYRRGFGWKDGRVKLPVKDIVHARAKGPRTDVWLQREGSARLQRLSLYLFTSEAADEVVTCLAPAAGRPEHPAAAAAKAAAGRERAMASGRVLAIAVLGVASAVAVVLLVLLSRRVY